MNEKKVVILHPCCFTRTGLAARLSVGGTVFSTDNLALCRAYLATAPQCDLLVLGVQRGGYTVLDALVLLHEHLSDGGTPCPTVVMLDDRASPGLSHYLQQLSPWVSTVSSRSRLPALFTRLYAPLSDTGVNGPQPPGHGGHRDPLSVNELGVFRALILGQDVNTVARLLSITAKKVSYCKRAGLGKLGVRNFSTLLLLPHGDRTPPDHTVEGEPRDKVSPCVSSSRQQPDADGPPGGAQSHTSGTENRDVSPPGYR